MGLLVSVGLCYIVFVLLLCAYVVDRLAIGRSVELVVGRG